MAELCVEHWCDICEARSRDRERLVREIAEDRKWMERLNEQEDRPERV